MSKASGSIKLNVGSKHNNLPINQNATYINGQPATPELYEALLEGNIFSFSWEGEYPAPSLLAHNKKLMNANLPNAKFVSTECFYQCENLLSVHASSAAQVQHAAFSECLSLNDVTLTSATYIGENAFERCLCLKSISLPNVTYASKDAFFECSSLVNVNLPLVKIIEKRAFENCRSLITLNLPAVAIIGCNAFTKAVCLENINIPNAKSINENAFGYCKSLRNIDLPQVTLTEADSAIFGECYNLEKVRLSATQFIPDWTFRHCCSLKQLILESPNVVQIAYNNQAFSHCCHILGTTESHDGVTYNVNAKVDGFIYVPDNMVNSYKTSPYWAKFANQIKGTSALEN